MPVILLDTEYTSWEGSMEREWNGLGEHREIVQIGAIEIEADNGFNELRSCSVLVKPKINPDLSNYFSNLTGISNELIEKATSLEVALEKYERFIKDKKVYACGNEGDIFAENIELYGLAQNKIPTFTSVVNLRPWFCKHGLNAEEIASGELHKHLNIPLNGTTHNALYDVRSILVSIRHLVKNGATNPFKADIW